MWSQTVLWFTVHSVLSHHHHCGFHHPSVWSTTCVITTTRQLYIVINPLNSCQHPIAAQKPEPSLASPLIFAIFPTDLQNCHFFASHIAPENCASAKTDTFLANTSANKNFVRSLGKVAFLHLTSISCHKPQIMFDVQLEYLQHISHIRKKSISWKSKSNKLPKHLHSHKLQNWACTFLWKQGTKYFLVETSWIKI